VCSGRPLGRLLGLSVPGPPISRPASWVSLRRSAPRPHNAHWLHAKAFVVILRPSDEDSRRTSNAASCLPSFLCFRFFLLGVRRLTALTVPPQTHARRSERSPRSEVLISIAHFLCDESLLSFFLGYLSAVSCKLSTFHSSTLPTHKSRASLRIGRAPAAGNAMLQKFSPPPTNSNAAWICPSLAFLRNTTLASAFLPLNSFCT
jgi:hypothetical protein